MSSWVDQQTHQNQQYHRDCGPAVNPANYHSYPPPSSQNQHRPTQSDGYGGMNPNVSHGDHMQPPPMPSSYDMNVDPKSSNYIGNEAGFSSMNHNNGRGDVMDPTRSNDPDRQSDEHGDRTVTGGALNVDSDKISLPFGIKVNKIVLIIAAIVAVIVVIVIIVAGIAAYKHLFAKKVVDDDAGRTRSLEDAANAMAPMEPREQSQQPIDNIAGGAEAVSASANAAAGQPPSITLDALKPVAYSHNPEPVVYNKDNAPQKRDDVPNSINTSDALLRTQDSQNNRLNLNQNSTPAEIINEQSRLGTSVYQPEMDLGRATALPAPSASFHAPSKNQTAPPRQMQQRAPTNSNNPMVSGLVN